jgi:hypothetical protein
MCVDTSSSTSNCGGCGVSCGAGTCNAGHCSSCLGLGQPCTTTCCQGLGCSPAGGDAAAANVCQYPAA